VQDPGIGDGEAFDTRYDKPALKPAHLNQMFAYMQNLVTRDDRGRQVDGLILYAAVSGGAVPGAFCQDWKLFGHNLRVASLDLSNDWRQIEKSLLSVIGINSPPASH